MAKSTSVALAAPAKKAAAKKSSLILPPAKKVLTAADYFKPNYQAISTAINKQFKLTSGNMSIEARKQSTISTGLLCLDLMSGGGIITGSWHTFLGGEGSAKSTMLAIIKMTAVQYNIPIMSDFDYEGAQDPRYYEGIMEYYGKLRKITDLYGIQNHKGEWIVPYKIFYANVSVAEDFFNPTAALMRRIPDKLYLEGKWWYAWDPTKEGRAAAGNKYSKSMYSRYQRLFVEAENGMPQAIFFLDSYPAMYPEKLDADDKGAGLAAAARALSENIPKVWSKMRGKGVDIIGVNQLRQKPMAQGDPWQEPAGEAVKFASSARWRHTARVPPHKNPATIKGGVEREPSALYDRASDTYRYVHVKNIKNKHFTPYQEFWQRVWVDDGTGMAHGFDPVYDTINYLKYTGQLICPEKFNGGTPMQLRMDGMPAIKLSYMDFKQLILVKGAALQPVLTALRMQKNPMIRERCFAQIKAGKGTELMFYTIANPPEKVKSQEEEAEGEFEISEDEIED